MNIPRILAGLLLSTVIGYVAYRRRSLTRSGWLGAVITGTLTFGFGGWTWGLTLIVFFVSSSLLSRFKQARKQQLAGEKFEKGGQRDLFQALANGGLAALLALIYGLTGEPPALLALFAGVMGTVTADTWATELGVLNRTPPLLLTTLRPVEPGTSGAVSLVGLAASLSGGLLVGLTALLLNWRERGAWSGWLVPAALFGGLAGSLLDSLLGATLQAIYRTPSGAETERRTDPDGTPHALQRGLAWLNNDLVNLISSIGGAGVALLVWWIATH